MGMPLRRTRAINIECQALLIKLQRILVLAFPPTTSAAFQNTLPPGDQHRTAPNAHLTAPWPMELGWGVSGDNLSATFMPRLCVYGRLLAPPGRGAATGIGIGL